MRKEFENNPVSFLLMASYAYYNLGAISIMHDHEYDELADYWYKNKEKFKHHPHFRLIPDWWGKEGSSGLEFHPSQLPNLIKSATINYLKANDKEQFELAKNYVDDPAILSIYYRQ